MKKIVLLSMISLLFVGASKPVNGREIRKDFHENFNVDRNTVLRLRHGDGNVTIRKWDKDEVDVEIRYIADYKTIGSGERDFSVEFREKKDILEITGREKSTKSIGFQIFDVEEYSYTIFAPSYLALDLNGDDGDIDIDEWRGKIDIDLDDGDITLTNVENPMTRIRFNDGEVEIENHKGDIDLEGDDGGIELFGCNVPDCAIQNEDGSISIRDCKGDFDIETDDGDIELFGVMTSMLDITMNDGHLDIELRKTKKLDMDISLDDGDADISLESGISATFTIDVNDGRIKIDLPEAVKVQKERRWLSGILGDGKGRIRIRGNDGSITLRELR